MKQLLKRKGNWSDDGWALEKGGETHSSLVT